MRLPRYRLRTLVILVMLSGVGVGGFALWKRSAEYGRRAGSAETAEKTYADAAISYREFIESMTRTMESFAKRMPGENLDIMRSNVDLIRGQAILCERRQGHYRGIKLQYRRAARYPWLRVAPEPPCPSEPPPCTSPACGSQCEG